jgi:succinyl-diaminopimelate desuccinylase
MTIADVSELRALAHEHPELDRRWLQKCLSDLVAIPSVTGPGAERMIGGRILRHLRAIEGCLTTVIESVPGRESIAAVIDSGRDGPSFVLNGHMDTVPPDDLSLWSGDPFSGAVRNGAVWGRGSVDMKAGLTCQLACARVFSRLRSRLGGKLVLQFACGEETGEPGTLSLLQRGFVGEFGITTEPTALAIGIAQRGVAYYRITLHGRSAHAANPAVGRNPLPLLARVLDALGAYEQTIQQRPPHPLFPPSTCTPTMARAGVQQNAVPDSCELVVDRRLRPGETPEQVHGELERVVAHALGDQQAITAVVEPWHHPFAASEIAPDAQLVQVLARTVTEATGKPARLVGTPYGSDVRNLINDAGIEAVTFGPGDVALAHAPNEHLPVAELEQAAMVITRAVTVICDATAA